MPYACDGLAPLVQQVGTWDDGKLKDGEVVAESDVRLVIFTSRGESGTTGAKDELQLAHMPRNCQSFRPIVLDSKV